MAFDEKTLTWKSYTINKALSTIEWVQLVNLKEFVIVAIDVDSKTFIVHVAIWVQKEMPVHSKRQAQVGALLFDKAPSEVPAKYYDYSNIFSADNAAEILEHIEINDHAIKLEEGKQPLFGPIYSLKPVELETMKTDIKTNLANNFIWPSKSSTRAPILFNRKPDESFRFCMDYRNLNNITIKSQYPLPPIGKLLDQLSRTRKFT